MSSNVIDLLNNNIATLIYAGDTDYICKYLGNKAWTDELKWKHHEEYKHSEPYDWKKQGMAKSYKGLTFLQVYDAYILHDASTSIHPSMPYFQGNYKYNQYRQRR